MKVLIVLTSHDTLGDSGEKTGFWAEEFATPYYALRDAGVEVTLATPRGGRPPLDPKSLADDFQTDATRRLAGDTDAQTLLDATVPLAGLSADAYDGVFYPGGHGPMWDLSRDQDSMRLIENLHNQHKPVAAVCHGPAVLVNTTDEHGEPLVKGRRVTCFSNSEEAAVGLDQVVPFLLETRLAELGATFSKADDWTPHVVEDGGLITGQNPASSDLVAQALLAKLKAVPA